MSGPARSPSKGPRGHPYAGRPKLMVQLSDAIEQYPGALARAAMYILENPEKAVHQSLTELSEFASVGQASVVRLCQELGFDGFSQFKIALSGDLAEQRAHGARAAFDELDPMSGTAELLSDSIVETRRLIDEAALGRVAARLVGANRIDLFGTGGSGISAKLIEYRLLRLKCFANAMSDYELAHEVSTGLDRSSAAIAVSQSGTTPETVRFLKTARDAGAFTVAVTCHPRSVLTKSADEVLLMARLRQPTYGGPITDVPRTVMVAEAIAMAIEAQRRKAS